MLTEGLTLTVVVGAVPLKAVPSDNVPEIVPLPVTAKDKIAELPLQILCVPLNAAVRRGFMVIAALPDLSELKAIHALLYNVAIV